MQSALALGAIGAEARDAAPQLSAALNDPEWSVRRQAAVSLGQIGPDAHAAAPALSRLQRDDPHNMVRKAAQKALPLVKSSGGTK
jgi:HEAT repeat protein